MTLVLRRGGVGAEHRTAVEQAARVRAARRLQSARAQARAIRAAAEAQAEVLRDAARDAGRMAAQAEAAQILVHAATARDALLGGAEDDILRLAAQLAERVIGEALPYDPGPFRRRVGRLLSQLTAATAVHITAHPDDLPSLRQALGPAADTPGLALHPDPACARGGCVLRSDVGAIDARIEVGLGALRDRLLERS